MSSKSKINFTITHLTFEDIPSTVDLHRQIFSDYFLSHMGSDFLKRFYREFITHPGYGTVAKYNGQIIGFVAGTTETDSFYNQFYRRNFGPLIMIVLLRFLSNAYVRQKIWSRLPHFSRALSARFCTAKTGSESIARKTPLLSQEAHLLSIGVAEEYRGYGVAEALSERFCLELKRLGVRVIYLSVFPDNNRAIRFYEKNGWQRIESEGSSILFSRQLES